MKRILIALAASTALIGAAQAGDLNHRGSLKDPVDRQGRLPEPEVQQERGVNWSGFYIGGRAGYGNANHEMQLDAYGHKKVDCPEESEDDFCTEAVKLPIGSIDGWNSSGFIGGGQIGYDQQLGRFVVGVFGSYDFSNMKTDVGGIGGIGQLVLGNVATDGSISGVSLEKDDEWSVGLRGGVLLNPKTLVYLLAAYTETTYELSGVNPDLAKALAFEDENTFSGVTIGGGIEVAVTNNVFFGLEYTHLFGGDAVWFDSCNAATASAKCGQAEPGVKLTDELSEDKIMGTLKVKLNTDIGRVFD